MRDTRNFRTALAELSAANARINALLEDDTREAEDVPGYADLSRLQAEWLAAVARHRPSTAADLVALARVMREPGLDEWDEVDRLLGPLLANGVLAILDPSPWRVPRLARAWGAYGLSLAADAPSRFMLRLARWLMVDDVGGQVLLFGVRAIAHELGVTRKQAWGMIRSGAIPSGTLGGVVCVRRDTLRDHLDRMERDGAGRHP